MWQTADRSIFPTNNPGIKIWDQNSLTDPAISIYQEIAPAVDDRSGGVNTVIKRTGGMPGSARFTFYESTANHADGYDVGSSTLAVARNLNGGVVLSKWNCATGPSNPNSLGIICTAEDNALEQRGDKGLKFTRDGFTSIIRQIVPESHINFGLGTEQGYNVSFGLVFAPSKDREKFGQVRTHVPILFESGTITKGGIGFLAHGSLEHTPRSLLELHSRWIRCIDLSNAEFISDAIRMKAEHRIMFGSSYISGVYGVPNGLMLGTDHLFWNSPNRSIYPEGNRLWYRWYDNGWHYQQIAGPV